MRKAMMLLNSVNHLLYAVLFVVRSIFYNSEGSGDRPFYYESHCLGWLLPAPLGQFLGWEKPYDQAVVLKSVMALVSKDGFADSYGFMGAYMNSRVFMFYYQIAEGLFHLMIVAGSAWLWLPRSGFLLTLYRTGLWLEIILMDLTYASGYTIFWAVSDLPGYYGLVTIMTAIHHATVLPDLVSAYCELKADTARTKHA